MRKLISYTLVYGVRTPEYNTPHYVELRKIMTELSVLGEIGATPPVELISFTKYLPQRLWGNWKTRADVLRKGIHDLHSPLVDRVMERREKLGSCDSFLDHVLDQQEKLKLTRNEIDVMCGNLLEGGTDTMANTILTLCQAMALYPDFQEEAHREIDAVLSDTELPTWKDLERLPYVNMVVKELLRWRPPAPTAFPHALVKGKFFLVSPKYTWKIFSKLTYTRR